MSFLLLAFVAIFGIPLLILAAELSAQFFFKHILRPYVHVPHTHLKWHLNPDAFPALQQRDITYRVNSEGERGDEPPRGGDCFRVLVLGGSAAECGLLDQDKTWSAQLQAILNQPESLKRLGHARAHVGLVARSEFDSTAVCQMLEALQPVYPNLGALVIMTGFSDFLRWLGVGAPSNHLPPEIALETIFLNHPQMQYSSKHLALKDFYKYLRISKLRTIIRHPSIGNHNASERAKRALVKDYAALPNEPDLLWEKYTHNLQRLITAARRHNYRLIFVRQPWFDKPAITQEEETHLWNGRIGHPKDPAPPRFLSHADLLKLCRRSDTITTHLCNEHHVEHIDLRSQLPARIGVYSDHFHFCEEGAHLVARIVADKILSSYITNEQ